MATVATSIDASSVSADRVAEAAGELLGRPVAFRGDALGQLARVAVATAGDRADDAEPHDQPVRPLQPAGVVRHAELVRQPDAGPERQQEPDADDRHERADRPEEERALRRPLPADREQPQRRHGDAAADEQEHAREVEEEGPVARHPAVDR